MCGVVWCGPWWCGGQHTTIMKVADSYPTRGKSIMFTTPPVDSVVNEYLELFLTGNANCNSGVKSYNKASGRRGTYRVSTPQRCESSQYSRVLLWQPLCRVQGACPRQVSVTVEQQQYNFQFVFVAQ